MIHLLETGDLVCDLVKPGVCVRVLGKGQTRKALAGLDHMSMHDTQRGDIPIQMLTKCMSLALFD